MVGTGDNPRVCWSLGDKCVLAGRCITGGGVALAGETSFACAVGAGCPGSGSPVACGTTEDGWLGTMSVLAKDGRVTVADNAGEDIGAKRSAVAIS